MPTFAYTALNTSGQTVTGSLAVNSRAEVFRKLEAQALTPVKVAEEAKSAKSTATAAAKLEDNQPVRLKRSQVILFTEELADMLDGGAAIQGDSGDDLPGFPGERLCGADGGFHDGDGAADHRSAG
jgi:general secretion pathway protein F/type IV pilus assembly protein PilC